ncbi:GIY-YIG nuclease family protein [candidate division KSB1 bacterium]
MIKKYYIYIMSNKKDGTLYIGITNDLKRRVYEHKDGKIKGFTKRYNLDKLIYFEEFKNIDEAIIREKMLKRWNRTWKTELLEKSNPDWKDLYDDLF